MLVKDYIRKNGDKYFESVLTEKGKQRIKYPNWIITDVRFPNELQAIKDRDGIIIRVNRSIKIPNEITETAFGKNTSSKIVTINFNEHSSETALDNTEFDYVIDNNSTIEELIKKVKEILIKEKII